MVDDGRRTTDGRTPDHGHPISSPCEPDGSGELIIKTVKLATELFATYCLLFIQTRLQSIIVYLEAYTDEQITKVSYGTIRSLVFV